MAELYQQFSLLNPKPSFDDSNGETPPPQMGKRLSSLGS